MSGFITQDSELRRIEVPSLSRRSTDSKFSTHESKQPSPSFGC